MANRGEDLVHGGGVADDVFKFVAVAHLGAELCVFFEQHFLLAHDHAIDLDRLAEEGGHDVEETMVGGELFLADEGLVDREGTGGAAMDFDGDTEEGDGGIGYAGLKAAGAIEEIGLGADIWDDAGSSGRDYIPCYAFAQGIAAAVDFFSGHADCRFGAQAARRFIQQNQGTAMHI